MNFVDVLAIFPYYMSLCLHQLEDFQIIGKAGKIVRLIRVMRILRIFKVRPCLFIQIFILILSRFFLVLFRFLTKFTLPILLFKICLGKSG